MSGTNSMADAWRMLQPQRGPCTSVPTQYKVLPKALALHYFITVQHEHSNKWLYQHAKQIQQYCLFVYETNNLSEEKTEHIMVTDQIIR